MYYNIVLHHNMLNAYTYIYTRTLKTDEHVFCNVTLNEVVH